MAADPPSGGGAPGGRHAVAPETLFWAMQKLAVAFPGSFGTDARRQAVIELWRELLEQHRWITRAVFVAGVYRIAWGHSGDFLPSPHQALAFFDAVRDAQARDARKRLPAPAPPTDDERRAADDRAEAAKAAAWASLPKRLRRRAPR